MIELLNIIECYQCCIEIPHNCSRQCNICKIYYCPNCKSYENCEICGKWFCSNCASISDYTYYYNIKYTIYEPEYFCLNCVPVNINNYTTTLKLQKEKNDRKNKLIKLLNNSNIFPINNNHTELQTNYVKLYNNYVENGTNYVEGIKNYVEDIKNYKKNLNINYIVKRLCEIKFLYEHCDLQNVIKNVKDFGYQHTKFNYMFTTFQKAEYIINSKNFVINFELPNELLATFTHGATETSSQALYAKRQFNLLKLPNELIAHIYKLSDNKFNLVRTLPWLKNIPLNCQNHCLHSEIRAKILVKVQHNDSCANCQLNFNEKEEVLCNIKCDRSHLDFSKIVSFNNCDKLLNTSFMTDSVKKCYYCNISIFCVYNIFAIRLS